MNNLEQLQGYVHAAVTSYEGAVEGKDASETDMAICYRVARYLYATDYSLQDMRDLEADENSGPAGLNSYVYELYDVLKWTLDDIRGQEA